MIKLAKVDKNYSDLVYRIIIAVFVGAIPYMIFGQIASTADIESCQEWDTQEKIDRCIESVNIIQTSTPIVSIAVGGLMAVVALKGVIWEWKQDYLHRADRTPLKQGTTIKSEQESIIEQKQMIEKQQNKEILQKYERMEDL